MKNLVTFSVEKAITVFMVIIAVMIFGVVSFTRLTTDLFPSVNIPFAVVITPYPGATPEDVENNVTIPLENAFQTTTNVLEVQTTSSENLSLVTLEFSPTTNMDSAVAEMRESLNALESSLPGEVGYPTIIRLNPNQLPVYTFSVAYEGFDLETLTEWVDDVMRPQVERVAGVATFDITGGYEQEIRIRLDQAAIDAYNENLEEAFALLPQAPSFTLDSEYISNIIQAQNFAFPAGFVEIDGLSYLVRVGDDIDGLSALENLVLADFNVPGANLQPVMLGDVATVAFEDTLGQQYSKVNGEDAITISIQKGSEFAVTEVTNGVLATLSDLEADYSNLEVTTLLNQGDVIEESTNGVLSNLLLGGILAIIVLLVFLRNIRTTLVVGIAIPVSLTFAVILIYLSGITLNVVSLGGLALGIGMLVDNSIVVIENIFRYKKEGKSNKDAAIMGTSQVAGAITASTLTTVGVFAPIIFIEDFIREIFLQLALTIAFSLVASLIIALTFVPAIANKVIRVQKDDNADVQKPYQRVYRTILGGFYRFKWLVYIVVLGLFGLAVVGSVSNGFEFFPATDEGTLTGTVSVPEDQALDFADFTADLDTIYQDISALEDVASVGITLGGGGFGPFAGGDNGSANLNIVLVDDRTTSTNDLRDDVADILAGYDSLETSIQGTENSTAFLVGSGAEILVQGPDLETLRTVATDVADLIAGIEGYRDVDAGLGRTTQEIKVTVDKDAAIGLNLTVAQVFGIIRNQLATPDEVTTLSLAGDLFTVRLFNEGDTADAVAEDIETFESIIVSVDNAGNPVFLSDVALIEEVPGFSSINRINGTRSVTVTAGVETEFNASLLAEDAQAALDDYELPEGFSVTLQGESEEIGAAVNTLALAAALGIVIVYMIMASQFQSLKYPFIIMITIPLAFTGGLGILYIFNTPVSVVALLGLIVLAGVIVNNGIVLVDYINQLRDQGYDLQEAILKAGETRLRPIFMTALTTILALTGLAAGIGDGTELTQPLALTSIGGLIYGTFLTIFVVPLMYDSVSRHGLRILLIFLGLVTVAAGGFLWTSDLLDPLLIGIIGGGLIAAILATGVIYWIIKRPKNAPKNASLASDEDAYFAPDFDTALEEAGDLRD